MADYSIKFSADVVSANASIKALRKEIERVTQEFEAAEANSDDFRASAKELANLKSDFKQLKGAVKDLGDEFGQVATKTRSIKFTGIKGNWAKALGEMEGISKGFRDTALQDTARVKLSWQAAFAQMEGISSQFAQQAQRDSDQITAKAEAANTRARLSWQTAFSQMEGISAGFKRDAIQDQKEIADKAQAEHNRIKLSWAKAFGQMESIKADFASATKARDAEVRQSWAQALGQMGSISRSFSDQRIKEDFKAAQTAKQKHAQIKMSWGAALSEMSSISRKFEQERISKAKEIRAAYRQKVVGGVRGVGRGIARGAGGAGIAALSGQGLGGGIGAGIGAAFGGPLGGAIGGAVGAGVDQLAGMGAQAVEQYMQVEQLRRGLALASIDAQDFAKANDAVREASKTTLIPLQDTYRMFTQLRTNTKNYNISVAETSRIFKGVALAVKASGGSLDDVQGAMRAVVQVFSKGSVQAEELRGQLGERFPGAVVKFAQANNMSFQELSEALKKGEVGIKEFVAFAEKNYEDYAQFAEKIATAPEFAAERAKLSLNEFVINAGKDLAPLGLAVTDLFAGFITSVNKFRETNKKQIGTFVRDIQIVIRRLSDFAGKVGEIAGKVAAFLGPAINALREFLGLKSAQEFQEEAATLSTTIAGRAKKRKTRETELRGMEGRYGKLTEGQIQQELRNFDAETARLQKRRSFVLSKAGEAAADPTQVAVNKTTSAAENIGADMVFGGKSPMDVTGTGKKDEPKEKAKKLRAFNNDLAASLRRRATIEKQFVDMQADLTTQQRTLQKARIDFQAGLDIADANHAKRVAGVNKIKVEDRAAYLEASKQQLEEEKRIAKNRFELAAGADFRRAMADQMSQQQQLLVNIENLKAGKEGLTQVEKVQFMQQQGFINLAPQEIALLLQKAEATDALIQKQKELNAEKKIDQEIEALKNQLAFESIVDPAAALREGIRQKNPEASEAKVEELAQLQEKLNKLQEMKQIAQDVASTIGTAFSQALGSIIDGSSSVEEALGNMLKSIGQSFIQMAMQIVQQQITMIIYGMIMKALGVSMPGSSGGPGMPQGVGMGGSGTVANTAGQKFGTFGPNFGIPQYANGGVVKGPTMAMIGEGKYNEAVVPLPNGRSIPVQMKASSRAMLEDSKKPTRSAGASPINMSFQTTKFGEQEYISRDQLEQAMMETRRLASRDGARRGADMAINKLQQSPNTRKRIGL